MSVVTIERKILEKNDEIARLNREKFAAGRVLVINLVSSPGSGKTSLVERMLAVLKDHVRIGVIEGDVQTDLDAQRVAKYGVPVVQIVTNGACHLEANLVRDALGQLDVGRLDIMIIENVGNLVCPASYDLGEHLKVTLLSVTEGDDKPLKYPKMFQQSSALIINKIDLIPYVPCNLDVLKTNALKINPSLTIFETSCTTGKGIDVWCDWLMQRRNTIEN